MMKRYTTNTDDLKKFESAYYSKKKREKHTGKCRGRINDNLLTTGTIRRNDNLFLFGSFSDPKD